MVCEVTGEGFSKSNSDVDHAPPVTFKFLVDSFISVNGIDVELVQYVPESRSGHGKGSVFADPELLDRWLQFHRQHAVLRVLSKDGHKQVTAENRKRAKEVA